MNIFTMFIFKQILLLGSECKNYNENTYEHKKCIKFQKLSNELLNQFKKENQELLDQLLQLMQNNNNQKFIGVLYHLYDKLDDYSNNININKKQKVLNELFDDLIDIEDYEFNFS